MTLYVYTCHTFTSGTSGSVVEPLVKEQDGPEAPARQPLVEEGVVRGRTIAHENHLAKTGTLYIIV